MSDNKIINVESSETDDNIIITNPKTFYSESYYTSTFYNDKDYTNFIKKTELLIRKSEEYASYLGYLKNTYGLNHCTFLGNIDQEKATIEYHHYPFTLYEICEVVINNLLKNNKKINTFKIADEVIKLHYKNKVGLVPLTVSMHKVAHSGGLFIDLKFVFGRFDEFIHEYENDISIELKKHYNHLITKSATNSTNTYTILDLKE